MTGNTSHELYVLQDGTHADPGACSPGKDGVLRHENGLAVCVDADGKPQTVGSDAVANMNVEAAKSGEQVAEDKKAEADRARAERGEVVRDRGEHGAPRPAPHVEGKPAPGAHADTVRNTEPLAPRKS